jgi:GntR family transcriptional regulator
MAHEQHAKARFATPEHRLDASSGVALYAQLAELFRYNISCGKWPSGHRLDNFESLAAQYKVARITVRQAVARLVQEQLLTTQRGRGTYVREAPLGSARSSPRVDADSWPERLAIEVLYNERTSVVPAEFRGDFGTFDVYREVTKIHRLGDAPFAMVRIFVAHEVFRRFPRRAIEQEKLLRLTFKHGGRAVTQMRQRMTIELADLLIAQHLRCAVGSPVAKILRQAYGADGKLFYAGISWYRGDAFEMDMTLPREWVTGSSPALIAPLRAKKS